VAKLTPKQERFVSEYMIDLNATQAAIRAGYSVKTAGKIGYQLLEKNGVKAAIMDAQAALSRRTMITQDKVLHELGKLGFSDVTDYLQIKTERILVDRDPETDEPISEIRQLVLLKDTDQIPEEKRAAIAEVRQNKDGSIGFKLHDKKGSLELLGRHLSMFTEKIQADIKAEVRLENMLDYTKLSSDELLALKGLLQKAQTQAEE